MPLRPCLDCRRLSPGPRCQGCTRGLNQRTLAAKREVRPHTYAEDKRRARVVAEWRATHGDWCPGYMRAPHHAGDLTADHPHAVARGGAEDQPLSVLCRSCNSSKKAHV